MLKTGKRYIYLQWMLRSNRYGKKKEKLTKLESHSHHLKFLHKKLALHWQMLWHTYRKSYHQACDATERWKLPRAQCQRDLSAFLRRFWLVGEVCGQLTAQNYKSVSTNKIKCRINSQWIVITGSLMCSEEALCRMGSSGDSKECHHLSRQNCHTIHWALEKLSKKCDITQYQTQKYWPSFMMQK